MAGSPDALGSVVKLNLECLNLAKCVCVWRAGGRVLMGPGYLSPRAASNMRAFGPLETPLTLAAQLDDPVEVIKALRNGGAHLDFRAKDGMTALHKAARARNLMALKVHTGPASHSDVPSSYPCVCPVPLPHPQRPPEGTPDPVPKGA